eukprot:m.139079 g.139079  ORF g.139079 m.139079 type:complete len:354 (-) comp20295_c0_seq10:20-1081(-)
MSDALSCIVCFEQFDEVNHVPHVLRCGHSLCATCLPLLPQRLCPSCKQPCGDNPPKNFSLLHILSQASRPKIPDPCTTCKTHSQPLRFFDLVCDKLLCCDCFAVDHAGHQCLLLDEAAKLVAPEVKRLKEIAKASSTEVAQAGAKLERCLVEIKEKKNTLAASITQTFAAVKRAVQQREQALLSQLDTAAAMYTSLISEQQKKLKAAQTSLEVSSNIPDQISHAQLLQSRANLISTLEKHKAAPPQLAPVHNGKLAFSHTFDKFRSELSVFGAVSSGSPVKIEFRYPSTCSSEEDSEDDDDEKENASKKLAALRRWSKEGSDLQQRIRKAKSNDEARQRAMQPQRHPSTRGYK